AWRSLQALGPARLGVAWVPRGPTGPGAGRGARQWQLRLERARYEADLARRRFVAVDPENRLVARSLEREWNDKLAEVERLEREHASLSASAGRPGSGGEGARLLGVAADGAGFWDAGTPAG